MKFVEYRNGVKQNANVYYVEPGVPIQNIESPFDSVAIESVRWLAPFGVPCCVITAVHETIVLVEQAGT